MTPTFLLSPKALPNPQRLGRVVLLDLAFASGKIFSTVTKPFIEAIGERLVAWIDHHSHPGWADFVDDPRFILVDKRAAPACPELIDEALVQRLGEIDTILAHGDFDGCIAAAKFLRRGIEVYPGADADARAIDAPGRGFSCSEGGLRLAHALDQAKSWRQPGAYIGLLGRMAEALVTGAEPADLTEDLDTLAAAQRLRLTEIEPLVEEATRPHADILVLRASIELSSSDRKALLCRLEEHARVAVIQTGRWVTAATFEDERFDLSELPGLEGSRGLAWGRMTVDRLVRELITLLATG